LILWQCKNFIPLIDHIISITIYYYVDIHLVLNEIPLVRCVVGEALGDLEEFWGVGRKYAMFWNYVIVSAIVKMRCQIWIPVVWINVNISASAIVRLKDWLIGQRYITKSIFSTVRSYDIHVLFRCTTFEGTISSTNKEQWNCSRRIHW